MSAAKSSSKKRKRDDSPSRELTVELSGTKTGKGGPYLSEYRCIVSVLGADESGSQLSSSKAAREYGIQMLRQEEIKKFGARKPGRAKR